MGRENEFGGSVGLEPAKARAAGRLFRNKSGHVPTARPAIGGGFIPAKPFGNLGRSRSSHQPRARCLGDQDQLKAAFAPPAGKLLQRKDWSLQSWVAKCREACLQELPGSLALKSSPVPISEQPPCKATTLEDHDNSPFMPPHEYLSLKELGNDPEGTFFTSKEKHGACRDGVLRGVHGDVATTREAFPCACTPRPGVPVPFLCLERLGSVWESTVVVCASLAMVHTMAPLL